MPGPYIPKPTKQLLVIAYKIVVALRTHKHLTTCVAMIDKTKMKILITRDWPAPALPKVAAHFAQAEFRQEDAPMTLDDAIAALQTYDIVAPTIGDAFAEEAFIQASRNGIRTKLLANFGAGYDHIDVDAAAGAGIWVTNTPGATTMATAEITMTLMLMCARRIVDGQQMLSGPQGWQGWSPTQLMGMGLNGKTLGIVGMGDIGKEVARKAYLGFGMDIIFYNRTPKAGMQGLIATQVGDLNDLCTRADVVSVHMASTPQTRGIIGAPQLERIGSQGILINTARGDLIDERATRAALSDGSLGAAGLDVFQGEPAIDPAWFKTPNATLLPHMGSATIETRTAMALQSFDNMKAFADGRPLPNPVNTA